MALAAGLGRLSVQSALGEPLRAEIELVSVAPGEAESLVARLASQEAFRQANVELNSLLFEVRFNVQRRADGQHVIVLTTLKPVNEPFVDMLVELSWSGGRLTREYTFLLDPPEYRGPAVAAPTLPVTPPAVKPLAAEPVRPPEVAAPAKPAAPSVQPPVAAAPAKPDAAKPAAGSYEVKRGDTLGRIARDNLHSGVNLQQMLVALYRSNEDAFISNNMNRLRAGRILNIPDRETTLAITPDEARKVVSAQSADFAEFQRSVGAAVASTAERPEGSRQAAGRIESGAAPAKPAPAAPAGDQLRLSKPDEKSAKGAAAAKADDAVARDKSLREAQERIALLEKNIADMKKLQDLKSAQGAQLQQQAEAAKAAKGEAQKAPPAPAAKAEPQKAPPAPAAKAEPSKPEPAKAEPAKDAPKAEPGKAAPAVTPDAAKAPAGAAPDAGKAAPPPGDAAKAAPDAAKAGDAPKAAEAPKAAPKAPAKAAPPPPPPPSLLDELVENIYAIAGLVLVAILLVAYAFYAWRKKKQASQRRFESSVMPSLPAEPNSMMGMAGGQKIDTRSSELTDFSQAGSRADADEIDPIAEADVYMAYGRDAQAEEILKEALAKDPQRHGVRLKLLEVYANRKDAASFQTHAKELHAATGGQGPEWDKAVALGQQVDPPNPLYGGSGSPAGVAAAAAAGAAAGMAAGAAMQAAADEPATAPALDFDLDVAAPGAQPDIDLGAAAPASHAAEQTSPIDFDLDIGGDKPAEQPAPDTATASAPGEPGSSIDFDLGMGGDQPAAPVAQQSAKPAEADGDTMDFDLKLDDFAPGGDKPAASVATAPEGGGTDFDLSAINLDMGGEGTAPAAGLDAKWQEVATKLDLAKAYEEMGDKDGARDLLNEVIREGDSAQQQQAKSMLEALS